MRLYRFLLAIIISLFLLSAPLHVFADYDLGDYDYTPVAKPDYKQYPATSEGFGAYCKDFALYCAAGTYDNTVQFITSFGPLGDDLNDLYSYFDEPNAAEVFRRLLFPNSAFSPFYDPYYERDFHVTGEPGSVGSEEYVWGDGILRFSYDFDRFFDCTTHYYSSISDYNNTYAANTGMASPLYTMVSYSLPGSGSAVWFRPHGLFSANSTNRHYSGSLTNPRCSFITNSTGDLLVRVEFDYTLTLLNTDTQTTWTQSYSGESSGAYLVILKAGDPNESDVRRQLNGVPRLLITPPTDDNIDDTPYCNLYSPDGPALDPVPYYYYIDDNGNYYLTPDPVLPSYPLPDNAIPISPDGTVSVGGNIYMPINVLNSFSNQMQSLFSVALTSYYTNIFIGLGGDMSNCGCPDYSNWLMLINSKLGTLDYDLQRIYDLLLLIYNKQSDQFPDLDLPEVPDGLTPTVVIQDFASIVYDRINPAPLFKGLSTILSFMFDGWVDPIGDDFFDISNYFDPDSSVSISSVNDESQIYNDSSFITLASEGSVSPSFPVKVGDYEMDLMSWYSPDFDPQLAVGKNFISIILVCGWILWFIRQIPSLFGSVSTVDRGSRGDN